MKSARFVEFLRQFLWADCRLPLQNKANCVSPTRDNIQTLSVVALLLWFFNFHRLQELTLHRKSFCHFMTQTTGRTLMSCGIKQVTTKPKPDKAFRIKACFSRLCRIKTTKWIQGKKVLFSGRSRSFAKILFDFTSNRLRLLLSRKKQMAY
ncbi:MAG: hypothetical protein NZ805_12445 [Armatimonadetes bacterium]|nr:hypothetical protein [Armatimonadota bacterium]MDW8029634.1 hypothetical protein [Armatimonadota bacterium]